MLTPLKAAFVGLALVLSAPQAKADETGQVSAKIDGIEAHYGITLSESGWSGEGDAWKVTIESFAADAPSRDAFPLFVLNFEALSGEVENAEVRLIKLTDNKRKRFRGTDDEGNLIIEIESSNIVGEQITVSGLFVGSVGAAPGRDGKIDLSDTLSISGSFSATLNKK